MKKRKIILIRIIASLVLFTIALFLPENIQLFVFLAAYLTAAYDVLISAVRNIIALNPLDENFLMAIASVGAFAIGKYSEGTAVMIFYQIGEAFQSYALNKSRRSIKELMDIQPDYANLERDGQIEKVSPEKVAEGDIIVVKPGEKIPLDGVVVSGSASVDTSAITGEALPRSVGENDDVTSGCVSLDGLIKIRVTGTYETSTAAKILEIVENCAAKKSKSEKFITKFAHYYTPVVVIGAVLVAVIPPLFGASWTEQIRRALIFLVVSCPCALVISVPLTFFGAIGGASRRGILIKGSEYIDRISKAKTVAFDKTGTLTEGVFKVSEVKGDGISDAELIKLVAHAEAFNEHPIAKSLKSEYDGEIELDRVSESTVIHGGVKTVVDGAEIYVGNEKLMRETGVVPPNVACDGAAVVYAARDGKYLGHFVIKDLPKPTAKAAIKGLKELGIAKTAMLTGDVDAVAQNVGHELGVDEIHAQLLPQNKVEIIEKLSETSSVIFVGDGINDAPVLARSDVGISMGLTGSGAAIEASDAVLMTNDPMQVIDLIKLSRKAMRIVTQNIAFALIVKIAVLLLTLVGFSNMWEAVFADVGVTVIVILNAMRMLKK